MASSPLSFEHLIDFVSHRMRMSHTYQPLMIKTLVERGGWASTRDIAARFLSQDESQLDYYAEITKRMPGRVLASHGVVERDGNGFRLLADVGSFTAEQRSVIARLCDAAVAGYTARRGDRIYNHRRAALGDISGTDRYEALRRAGFRCELCGVRADERALEVDHIVPRRHGGSDDRSNLQGALLQVQCK